MSSKNDDLEKEVQFTRVCEAAAFVRRVSLAMISKTIPDVNDGFGDRTADCREYTRSREDPNSRIYAMIPGQTTIGPDLQVHMTRCLDVGIETQIPSTMEMVQNPGWLYPEATTATWRSYVSMIQTTIHKVPNW